MKAFDPLAPLQIPQNQTLPPRQVWEIEHSEDCQCSEAVCRQYGWIDEKGKPLSVSKWLDPEGEDSAETHGLGFVFDGTVIRKLKRPSVRGERAMWDAVGPVGQPLGAAAETIREVLAQLEDRRKWATWTGRRPQSVDKLGAYGRLRLSDSFWMRSFLYSDIAEIYGIQNIPDDPALAAESGRRLCENILEPIQAALGPITVRSAFRSAEVNDLGNKKNHQCSRNERTAANHIWDLRDKEGFMGATASIIVNSFVDYFLRLPEIGKLWHGGITTTSQDIRTWSSTLPMPPLISAGTRTPTGPNI